MRLGWLIATLLLPLTLQADEGQDIAQQADAVLRGYTDAKMTLEMVLVSPSGETASRVLRVQSKEMGAEEGDRTLMVFETPRDVAGTALLSYNHPQGEDEQWLYLPAVKRVKQIGARNKSGPFMGSEFAFEDIVTPFWQKYGYRYLRQEPCAELTCQVIERTPNDSESGYTRQLVWIDTQNHLTRQIEYYDRRNALLKTYSATGFSQHAGQHWRPAEMRMVNHQNNKQTRLLWRDFQFGTGQQDQDFTQNALMRTR